MAMRETTSIPITEPGWYRDPQEAHQLRYFDGIDWTAHVTHGGPTPCDRCFDRARNHR